MRLAVRVRMSPHRDGLWRDGTGLLVQIRAVPEGGDANAYLMQFLSGSLRVAPSLMRLVRGQKSTHKLINIDASEADLRPMLDALPAVPPASLFD